MKNKTILSLLVVLNLFIITGCGSKNKNNKIDDNNSISNKEPNKINDSTIVSMIDKTKEIDDFVCDTALDPF